MPSSGFHIKTTRVQQSDLRPAEGDTKQQRKLIGQRGSISRRRTDTEDLFNKTLPGTRLAG